MQGDPKQSPSSFSVRSKKRDEAIRKKVQESLRKTCTTLNNDQDKRIQNERFKVSSLRPNVPLLVYAHYRVVQACHLMAAKRSDAVLVINEHNGLIGILTDKDIVYRVVANGLDVQSSLIADIMTPNPQSVNDSSNRNAALDIMISRKFRHLPVVSDSETNGQTVVSGILDITKCVFDRLEDLEKRVTEDKSIIDAMGVLQRRGAVEAAKAGLVRDSHGCPDIATILLQEKKEIPKIAIKASVRDAAKVMKTHHSTAVLVVSDTEGEEKVSGIFTTKGTSIFKKDVVLRVIAANLDPLTTSIVRVMTPHPDFITPDSSILEAMKKLHAGRYLHLPVLEGSVAVGLVDVMTLTVAMITYLMNNYNTNYDEKEQISFWDSAFSAPDDFDAHSVASSQQFLSSPLRSSAVPDDLSTVSSYPHFVFKVKDMSRSKVYRFTSELSIQKLYENVSKKIGAPYKVSNQEKDHWIELSDGNCCKLSYLDDEQDLVFLETDKDIEEAVYMCRRAGKGHLIIFAGDALKANAPSEQDKSQGSEFTQTAIPVQVNASNYPFAINVGIYAGIVLITAIILAKIQK